MMQVITPEELTNKLSEFSALKNDLEFITKRIISIMDGLSQPFAGSNEASLNLFNEFNDASRQTFGILGLYEEFLKETIDRITPTGPDTIHSKRII